MAFVHPLIVTSDLFPQEPSSWTKLRANNLHTASSLPSEEFTTKSHFLPFEMSAIMVAPSRSMVDLLIEKGVPLDNVLVSAAASGKSLDILESLVAHCPDQLNEALSLACLLSHFEQADFLIERGASFAQHGTLENLPFKEHLEWAMGHLDTIPATILLTHPHLTVSQASTLVEKGASVNGFDDCKPIVAQVSNPPVLKFLLYYGASFKDLEKDMLSRVTSGESIRILASFPFETALSCLVPTDPSSNSTKAFGFGGVDPCFLQRRVVSSAFRDGNPLSRWRLPSPTLEDQLDLIFALMGVGIDFSPFLGEACPKVAQTLLDRGTVDPKTAFGFFNCHDPETATVLIHGGLDVNLRSDEGLTPFLHALRNCGFGQVVSLLEEKGADVMATDDEGRGAFHYALCQASLYCGDGIGDVCKDLVKRGIAPFLLTFEKEEDLVPYAQSFSCSDCFSTLPDPHLLKELVQAWKDICQPSGHQKSL